MNEEELQARLSKCFKNELCFISLKKIESPEQEHIEYYNGIPVCVKIKYATKK